MTSFQIQSHAGMQIAAEANLQLREATWRKLIVPLPLPQTGCVSHLQKSLLPASL
jgi:hypothetical protein